MHCALYTLDPTSPFQTIRPPTLNISHTTLHTRNSTGPASQSTFYTLHCEFYTPALQQSTCHTPHSRLYTLPRPSHCKLYTPQPRDSTLCASPSTTSSCALYTPRSRIFQPTSYTLNPMYTPAPHATLTLYILPSPIHATRSSHCPLLALHSMKTTTPTHHSTDFMLPSRSSHPSCSVHSYAFPALHTAPSTLHTPYSTSHTLYTPTLYKSHFPVYS